MGETMAEIREFFNAQSAFDPEAIQTLASALEDVWRTVETSGSRFARPAYARAIREVLAKRIIEVAQRGENDKRKLAADALNFLATNYADNSTRKRTPPKYGGSQMCGSPESGSTRDALNIEAI
jgi:hypothetical protein